MADNRCVILFVKYPEPGKVKSRLAREIDGDMVLRLYDCMVLDTIDTLKQAETPFRICFDPPDAKERVRQWLGQAYSYMPQNGEGLGERMEQAFTRVFSEGVDEVLLIGSDIPELTAAMIIDAFQALATHDAVIGPANDGGYYLIGFKKGTLHPEFFKNIAWGTKTVFRETLARLRKASLTVHRLPELTDIDTKADVEVLLSHVKNSESMSSRTVTFLRELPARHRYIAHRAHRAGRPLLCWRFLLWSLPSWIASKKANKTQSQ